MVTGVVLPTTVVATVNVRLVAPAGTVTLPGTVATAVLLLDRLTTLPPEGAGELNVAVPVDGEPPMTFAGFNDSEASELGGARTVITAVRVALRTPVMVRPCPRRPATS